MGAEVLPTSAYHQFLACASSKNFVLHFRVHAKEQENGPMVGELRSDFFAIDAPQRGPFHR